MKKIAILLLIAMLGFVAVGCGGEPNKEETDNAENATNTSPMFPSFETVDLDDQPVTDRVFAEHQLTLVNIWGTYCDPCREELPALQALYQEMAAKNVNVIGIVVDGEENDLVALQMIKEYGITYANLMPSDNLKKNLFTRLPGVPTSFFVNDKGEVVGDMVVGARTGAQYKAMIDQLLPQQQ
jgi:thiol-disulfide isomerase/thioredoxin